MPAWQFGVLIATGTEIPAWAEALEEEEIGEAELQPSCLKMWIQLRLRPAFVAAVMLKLRSMGLQLAGMCCGNTCSHPCRYQAARGSWPPEKPRDGCAPAAGGCWGGQHLGETSGWRMGSALKVVCKKQKAQGSWTLPAPQAFIKSTSGHSYLPLLFPKFVYSLLLSLLCLSLTTENGGSE